MASSMTSSPLHCLTFWLLLAQLTCSVNIPPSSSLSGGSRHELNPQHSSAYIVYADHVSKPSNFTTLDHWYTSMVASLSPAANSTRFLHVYDTVMHGFAAELTVDEARRVLSTPGVTFATTVMPELDMQRYLLHDLFPETKLFTEGFEVLSGLLTCNPDKRLTAAAALKHPWFGKVDSLELPKKEKFALRKSHKRQRLRAVCV